MTTEPIQHAEAPETSAQVSDSASLQNGADGLFGHKPKRTLGLKIFDGTFYGGVVNTAVMVASAASTYWTYHGNTVGKAGSWLRWIGEGFHKRREPIEKALSKIGAGPEASKIGTTVVWSFVDGSLFAPLIKLIEDRRERIALGIDTLLGTKAENMQAYDAEPKQGWKSVLVGRAETLGIVLPVAILMEYSGGNKKIFYNGGDKIMAAVEKKMPKLNEAVTSLVSAPHVPELAHQLGERKKTFFQVFTFEAFYTTICTIGTYLFSRGFARKHAPKEKEPTHAHAHATHPVRDEANLTEQPTTPEPTSKINSERQHEGVVTNKEREAANDGKYTIRA